MIKSTVQEIRIIIKYYVPYIIGCAIFLYDWYTVGLFTPTSPHTQKWRFALRLYQGYNVAK